MSNKQKIGIACTAIFIFIMAAASTHTNKSTSMVDISNCQFTLDRIENGVDSDWAVVEIYDQNTGNIYMVDIEIGGYIR